MLMLEDITWNYALEHQLMRWLAQFDFKFSSLEFVTAYFKCDFSMAF